MSPVRVEPASPGCCLLSLLLLPFNIFFLPLRIVFSGPRRRYPVRNRYL